METFELVPPPLKDWSSYRPRQLSELTTVMFHRIGPSLPGVGELKTAEDVAGWFKENGIKEIGSSKMPYTFVIPREGPKVYQAVPLRCVTPHANSWNRSSVSVALVGDFRKDKPTPWQVEAAKWISQRLQDTLGRDLTLERHSLAPGGTSNPTGHECPGWKFRLSFEEIQAHIRRAFFVVK